MREAIEGTGATFHNETDIEPECWEGRSSDQMEAYREIVKEYSLEHQPFMQAIFALRSIMLEMKTTGLVRFLRGIKPAAVVYCPLANEEAALAAQFVGIPHIGLNTIAGPGAMAPALQMMAKSMYMTLDELDQKIRDFQLGMDAHRRLQAKYGRGGDGGIPKPYGYSPHSAHAALTMVTTTEDFFDPISPELQQALDADASKSVAVGPLFDEAGAKRAAGHKSNHDHEEVKDGVSTDEILEKVRIAHKSGRAVVLGSMGTVITGDMSSWGWEACSKGADGQPRGLKGKELCRGAWAGLFDAFGSDAAEEGPLIVLALGPQPNALGELVPPPNAICVPALPQVDLLKAGIDIFLTHGGQNSFTEALASNTPVVVCPGFGDQPVNAQKAVDIGVGLKVDRPDPDAGHENEAVTAYQADVKGALLKVFGEPEFKARAANCGKKLRRAGGVPRAVQLVLEASSRMSPQSVFMGGA